MSTETAKYICPSCTGGLKYDGATGKLKCEYCGNRYTLEEIEATLSETYSSESSGDWDQSLLQENWGKDASKISVYHCTSCMAELICDTTTVATNCPYCGSHTIITEKTEGNLKPDYIIPFKIDKNTAISTLKKYYAGKKLLPRTFSENNHIQEIQGVYVPFWLYDGTVEADIDYSGVIITTRKTPDEEITKTDFYKLHREGTVSFDKIPVDASEKMDDALMDSIEPYNYDDLKPFNITYLSGYLANKYDQTVEDCSARADRRAYNTTMNTFHQSTKGFSKISIVRKDLKLNRGKVHYALMPVWILNTQWKDQNYIFAMNGQTGKMVGDLPEDKNMYLHERIKYGAVIAAVIFIIQMIMNFI